MAIPSRMTSLNCLDPNLSLEHRLARPCPFDNAVFLSVLLNLIKNPNITSSHLFRADIIYDSKNDASYQPRLRGAKGADGAAEGLSPFWRHMQPQLRPVAADIEGFEVERTIVRRLVPRNPRLDRAVVQTCHVYSRKGGGASVDDGGDSIGCAAVETLVLYLPHVQRAEDVPFYHPQVRSIAFLHSWSKSCARHQSDTQGQGGQDEKAGNTVKEPLGQVSIYTARFPSITGQSEGVEPPRLSRTIDRILTTIVKHGTGSLRGYTKRVHHDQVIPQDRFQDTYTRLKLKYAKALSEDWREQTDPTKHVFEDLGIAAFLIELWRDMYNTRPKEEATNVTENSCRAKTCEGKADQNAVTRDKDSFPGFIDIACGNGLLVHILCSEGYSGWGFDARRRKSWQMFSQETQDSLHEAVLIPHFFTREKSDADSGGPQEDLTSDADRCLEDVKRIDGIFPKRSFIISNHADELTVHTPIIAYSSGCNPFLCIPCCSHDLAGQRTRFSKPAKQPLVNEEAAKTSTNATKSTQESTGPSAKDSVGMSRATRTSMLAAESGSVASNAKSGDDASKSAYATLCAHVEQISAELGYDPVEREVLRIPSTRNVAVLCRGHKELASASTSNCGYEKASIKVREVVGKELQRSARGPCSLDQAATAWCRRAEKVARGKGAGGH